MEWEEDGPVTLNTIDDALVWDADYERYSDDDKKIALKDLFKQRLTINYGFQVADISITKTGSSSTSSSLQIYLVILLPMKFEFSSTAETTEYNGTRYKKLDIEMLRDAVPSGDLFGRTESGGEDDIFGNIKSVAINLYGFNNTIINNLALGIKNDSTGWTIDLDKDSTAPRNITLTSNEIGYPFEPVFELLVPGNENFKILRPNVGEKPVIDFSIAVQADMALDQTINF
jgi:hypothetical protein